MLILGFDTCTEMCTVALGDGGGLAAAIDVHAPRAHLQRLLPLAEEVLAMCGRTQADIEAVAVGVGPGSLTGVRIGVTMARSLAQGLGVRCIGVPTLDAIAHAFSGTGATICALLDARRQEVYPALYDCRGTVPKRLSEFRAVKPNDLCDELAERPETVLLAGDGLAAYGEMMAERLGDRARVAPRGLWHPRAANIVELASDGLAAGAAGDYHTVRPIYTRLSDAEEAERARQR